MIARLLLPRGTDPAILPLLAARSLRAFADGYVAVLLPAYLLALGFGTLDVGILSTATLLGSALATLGIGLAGHRWPHRHLLQAAALLMLATGLGFAGLSAFWALLLLAFVGTLNPSSGDVSVFLPLEHARLADAAAGPARAALFARYSLLGALFAALGALASAVPQWLPQALDIGQLPSFRLMFVLYGGIGGAVWLLYRQIPARQAEPALRQAQPLEQSRPIVIRLAILFSVDAFAGGLAINALMALWLYKRCDLSLAAAGNFFFCTGLLAAASQLVAPKVAEAVGAIKTMVFTHIPANVCLICAAVAPGVETAIGLLLLRSLLSQMDVPVRIAYVMSVVTPGERAAAASFTAVPRSLAAAASPAIGGALFAAGWLAAPLVACGLLKIAYDLTLWRAFKDTGGGRD